MTISASSSSTPPRIVSSSPRSAWSSISKTAEARASALPERTRSAEAFPPSTSPSAVSSRLFPAPVSPVQRRTPPPARPGRPRSVPGSVPKALATRRKGLRTLVGTVPIAGSVPSDQPVRAFHLTIPGPAFQTPAGSRTVRRPIRCTASFLELQVPHMERG